MSYSYDEKNALVIKQESTVYISSFALEEMDTVYVKEGGQDVLPGNAEFLEVRFIPQYYV